MQKNAVSATPVTIPLLNPNEPEAALTALYVQEGQYVRVGDPLGMLETTKATAELYAEAEGYVSGLRAAQGQTLRAGEVLCYLASSPDWTPPTLVASAVEAVVPPEGLRITQPALALARQHALNLQGRFPPETLITTDMVQELIEQIAKQAEASAVEAFSRNALVIYGGGGHGKALIDLLRALGDYQLVGVLDDGMAPGQTVLGLPILGGSQALAGLYARGLRLAVNAVGGIGNLAVRVQVFENLRQAGFACPTVVHPTAYVEPSATLAEGVQVFPHAYVGSEARLGYGVIVNTGAIVSHDCMVGDYANLAPGAILAGGVQVGAETLIGMGVTINLRVRIGRRARLGNGATVKADVPEGGIVRAGAVWPS